MAITLEEAAKLVYRTLAYLPAPMHGDKATVMLLAIGLQESRFQYTRQLNGPARGYWQFEKGGGVKGVMTHKATKDLAVEAAHRYGVEPTVDAVYNSLEFQPELSCAFARLLLWTDPKPLPPLYSPKPAWDLYLRVWRPGKPHRETWDGLYNQAIDAL